MKLPQSVARQSKTDLQRNRKQPVHFLFRIIDFRIPPNLKYLSVYVPCILVCIFGFNGNSEIHTAYRPRYTVTVTAFQLYLFLFNVIYVRDEWEHFGCEILMKSTVNYTYNGSAKKMEKLLIIIFEKRRQARSRCKETGKSGKGCKYLNEILQ